VSPLHYLLQLKCFKRIDESITKKENFTQICTTVWCTHIFQLQGIEILALCCVNIISVKIYFYNQPQCDPTIIYGTVNERTV
jgi:hypothetical protein